MRTVWCLVITSSLLAQTELVERLQRTPRLSLEALLVLKEDLSHAAENARKDYWRSLVEYHLVWKLRGQDPNNAQAMLEKAIARLEPLQDPEAKSLQGGCLDLMIGFNRARALSLAPKAARLIQQAEQAAPENPRVKVFWGIHCVHIPALFGGGPHLAMKTLEAALRAAETEARQVPGDPWLPRWGRIEAMAWLAEAQSDSGKRTEAKATVDRALVLDPEYPFARALRKELQ